MNVSLRRLAFLVSGAVRVAMSVGLILPLAPAGDSNSSTQDCEAANMGRTNWPDEQWRIGTRPGHISQSDVIILGIVYVSPGRVMPLLQLRADFGE